MRKLVRRSVQAALLAGGFVVVTAVGASASPVDTLVANKTESEATTVAEHNGILSGNAGSAPINVPVVENQVAVTGIGAAINADDTEAALGILGLGNTGLLGGGDSYAADSALLNKTESEATTVSEHNGILSGNAGSAPVNVPIAENQVSVTGIGAAINADDSEGALGILGLGNTGLLGGGDAAYASDTAAAPAASSDLLGLGNASDLLGATQDLGLGNVGQNDLGLSSGLGQGVVPMSSTTYGAEECPTDDDDKDKDKGKGNGGGGWVDTAIWNKTESDATTISEHNGILSGNAASVPVNVVVTENQVAVAGIGAAGNLDDTEAALGLLGLGNTGVLGGGGDGYAADTAIGNKTESDATTISEHNGILSGNAISLPVNVVVAENQASGTLIGAAGNLDDSEAALGLLGLGNTGLLSAPETLPAPVTQAAAPVTQAAAPVTQAAAPVTQAAAPVANTLSSSPNTYGADEGYTPVADTVVTNNTESEAVTVAEHNGIGSGNAVSAPVNVPVVENAVSAVGIGAAGNADDSEVAIGAGGVGSTGYGENDTVIANSTESEAVTVAEHNGIGSGNAVSLPVNVPIAENQVAGSGIGAAGNLDDTEAALGLLGGALA